MRSNEEMLRAVHERAAALDRAKRKKRRLLMESGVVALALALIVLLASAMPSLQERWTPDATLSLQASALTDSGMLGFVVVGILAFLLGVAVTVFCVLLRDKRDREDDRRDRDR